MVNDAEPVNDLTITCPKTPACLNCDCLHRRALTSFCARLPDGWLGHLILSINVHNLESKTDSAIIVLWIAGVTEEWKQTLETAAEGIFCKVVHRSEADITPQECYDLLDANWRGYEMDELRKLVVEENFRDDQVIERLLGAPRTTQHLITSACAWLRGEARW